VEGLDFDSAHLTLAHDTRRWLAWQPDHTPRGGDTLAAKRTRVRWEDVVLLDATGPYSELWIHYRTETGAHAVRARHVDDERDWATTLTTLFRYASTRMPADRVREGWVSAPELSWEPLAVWPDEEREVVYANPYRAAATEKRVRAIRAAPTGFEALLEWLASTSEHPWRELPRRVVLTRDRVCIERRDKRTMQIDRHALRGRRRTESGDRVYFYGRRARLLLPLRDAPCPVVWELDDDYRRIVGIDPTEV
jgi:hypothetical protein